ncbi:uncharacterized protein [Lolium perenne]|uniref:uncharacterized protein n=1 Tax=Lolium perenne TaxID=4522 RepID=UPI003A990CAE
MIIHAGKMAGINKKEFEELQVDGSNYLSWAMDMKINLTGRNLGPCIATLPENAPEIPQVVKYVALHFIRHHLHPDLKTEYLMEEDPLALWNSLKERYDQQRAVMLPEAQREWSLIRFQDFKSVAAYNSAVHKINSKLRFCNKQVSDEDLIEKTLCTFHPSMRILQQQYRQQKYTKYSELIYTLLQAEKHDELLMENHNARPTGAMPIPEAHANAHFTSKFGNRKRNFRKFKGKWKPNNGQKTNGPSKGNGQFNKNNQNDNSQTCQMCGCTNHRTNECSMPDHLVELYMKYGKEVKQVHGNKAEAHFNDIQDNSQVGPSQSSIEEFEPKDDIILDEDMLVDYTQDVFGDLN